MLHPNTPGDEHSSSPSQINSGKAIGSHYRCMLGHKMMWKKVTVGDEIFSGCLIQQSDYL